MTSRDRSAIWDQTPSWASNPMSPTKKEAHRMERENKQFATGRKSAERLKAYTTHMTSRPPEPLNPANIAHDFRVQDLLSLPGQRVTIPSKRGDRSIANNNIIRYQRDMSYHDPLPKEGGHKYETQTLTDNWVEDRRDRDYTPGWHPKELRLNRLWDTENTANYVMHDPEYSAKAHKLHAVALPAPVGGPLPKQEDSNRIIHYGVEGFGEKPRQDHTTMTKRGGFWLGITPTNEGETIRTTAHDHRQYLEFQARSPTCDPRAKHLGTIPNTQAFTRPVDKWTQKAYNDLYRSQEWTSTWRTQYNRDFTSHIGPDPGRLLPTARHFTMGPGSLRRPTTTQDPMTQSVDRMPQIAPRPLTSLG